MTVDLKLMTWNATGIMSSSSYLCDVLSDKDIDICGLAEHWLYEKDLIFLDQLNSSYKCHAVSDFDLKFPGRRRVGKGGVALLWHRRIDHKITPLTFEDDRIIGLQLEISPLNFIYVFQVYLPCSNHPMASFYDYVDKMSNLLALYSDKGLVIIMGDLNTNLLADPPRIQNNRTRYMINFLASNNFVSVNTMEFCSGASSTFVSYDNKNESLIDHILLPVEQLLCVLSCEICDDEALNVSRHRPIICQVRVPNQQPEYAISNPVSCIINWKRADVDTIQRYRDNLENNHQIINLVESSFESKFSIDKAYTDLVGTLKYCAKQSFPRKRYKSYLKPYWTTDLTELHKSMMNRRKSWVDAGKPRGSNHVVYSLYKASKRHFRRKHRQASEAFMKSQFDEIDRLAEVDHQMFWHHVNSRRKRSCSSAGSNINFGGRTVFNERDITCEWAKYFSTLYTPLESPNFDDSFKDTVLNSLQILNQTSVYDDITISSEEVDSAIRLAHRGKACGEDGIFYEHLMFGGYHLYEILAKLFSAMIKLSYVPTEMKKGVIITLFKGGSKRKDNPDNYRAITLSSVLLKLLERIVLTRIQLFDNITPPIHALQGGFQKNIGCLMTSFLFRESIFYAKENGSKVYVCFLDVKKAFDCVWHAGLFYKLYQTGINGVLCKLIINMYTDMHSCVRGRGFKSDWFHVCQGTRQGGVLSPFLYLLFINELIYELEATGLGFFVYDTCCGVPTVADDMVVGSFSKHGLQNMLAICLNFANKWRFEYGIIKCLVVVFNELKNAFLRANRLWKFGNSTIEEGVEYKHLGVICDKHMSIDKNVKDACNKIRGTFLSLVNSGIHQDGLNPLTSKRIYTSIVLPKALYGCEVWSNLNPNHIMSLERAHRFCLKFMQGLPKSTSTDVTLSLIGLNPIESEIDYKKLVFLGQLCRLPGAHRVKEIFIHRLVHFNESPAKKLGFLPDIYRILNKYSITHILDEYKQTGSFPNKLSWKKLVRKKINALYRDELLTRISTSEPVSRISKVHANIPLCPHVFWIFCKECPRYKKYVYVAVRLIGLMFCGKWSSMCQRCGEKSSSPTDHILLFCPSNNAFRSVLWRKLIARFGFDFYIKFISLSASDQVNSLLSGCCDLLYDESDRIDSMKIFLMTLKVLVWDNVYDIKITL